MLKKQIITIVIIALLLMVLVFSTSAQTNPSFVLQQDLTVYAHHSMDSELVHPLSEGMNVIVIEYVVTAQEQWVQLDTLSRHYDLYARIGDFNEAILPQLEDQEVYGTATPAPQETEAPSDGDNDVCVYSPENPRRGGNIAISQNTPDAFRIQRGQSPISEYFIFVPINTEDILLYSRLTVVEGDASWTAPQEGGIFSYTGVEGVYMPCDVDGQLEYMDSTP
ncbi:hypothetical protein KC669_03390 [Candidatus Dojkabacteria bacterium]|uniref:SH3 domain-containing protein n=1 Tax=Candidatus Dojkabacteria bacterium TaxID=2099670 RepID=A0A955LAH1_9BACT|nr:hypothetical protein [Candidatus Dojkabacteria bacterium]